MSISVAAHAAPPHDEDDRLLNSFRFFLVFFFSFYTYFNGHEFQWFGKHRKNFEGDKNFLRLTLCRITITNLSYEIMIIFMIKFSYFGTPEFLV